MLTLLLQVSCCQLLVETELECIAIMENIMCLNRYFRISSAGDIPSALVFGNYR